MGNILLIIVPFMQSFPNPNNGPKPFINTPWLNAARPHRHLTECPATCDQVHYLANSNSIHRTATTFRYTRIYSRCMEGPGLVAFTPTSRSQLTGLNSALCNTCLSPAAYNPALWEWYTSPHRNWISCGCFTLLTAFSVFYLRQKTVVWLFVGGCT